MLLEHATGAENVEGFLSRRSRKGIPGPEDEHTNGAGSDVDEISLAREEGSPTKRIVLGNQSFLHFHDNDRRTRAESPPIRKVEHPEFRVDSALRTPLDVEFKIRLGTKQFKRKRKGLR